MNDNSVVGAWLSGVFEGLGIFPVISFHRGHKGESPCCTWCLAFKSIVGIVSAIYF